MNEAAHAGPDSPEYLAAIGKLAGAHAALDQSVHDAILDRFEGHRGIAKVLLDKVVGFEAILSILQKLYHDAPDIKQTCFEIRNLNESRNAYVHSHALFILDDKGLRTEIHNRRTGSMPVPSVEELSLVSEGLARCGLYIENYRETWMFDYDRDRMEAALEASYNQGS